MASKPMRRLDRSRSAGQYFPPIPHETVPGATAHFEQDGMKFDHDGVLIEAFLTPEQKKKLDAKAAQAAAPAPKTGEPAAKTEPQTRLEKRQANPDKDKQPGGDQLNLVAWLMGEERYQEFRVKKVVRDRYSRQFGSINDLVEFLVTDQHLVQPEQLAPEFKSIFGPPDAETETSADAEEDVA